MSDENETVVEPEPDKVITEVKEELDTKGENLSQHDLDALKDELKSEIKTIRKDKNTDSEEKAALEAKVDNLTERIEGFLKSQEEKDKKQSDSSTLLVPPKDIGEATHLNKEEVHVENEPTSTKESRGWKKFF